MVISEGTKQARLSSFRYLPQQVSHLYLLYILFCLQPSTPKVQWLTGNRRKLLENARLAGTDYGYTHDSAKKKKKKKARLEALILFCSALIQVFQQKCGLKEILCVVLRFYCLTVMQ